MSNKFFFQQIMSAAATLNPRGKKVAKADSKRSGTSLDKASGPINEGNPDLVHLSVQKATSSSGSTKVPYAEILNNKGDRIKKPVLRSTSPQVGKPTVGLDGAIYRDSEVVQSPSSQRLLRKR